MRRITLPLLGSLLLLGACMDQPTVPTALPPESAAFAHATVGCDVAELISAIDHANATAGPQVIDLAPGCTYTLTYATDATQGPNGLILRGDITINGNGATVGRSSLIGTAEFRIFYIAPGATVSISGLTISRGLARYSYPSNSGGGIYNRGTLTLTNSSVLQNRAEGVGGGIFTDAGTLTVTRSMISGNTAHIWGGGISNRWSTLTVTHSSIWNNRAPRGGGIDSGTTTVTPSSTYILNSTITENVAFDHGGGVANSQGLTRISHSTILGNQAPSGAGLWSRNDARTFTLVRGSIIWFNVRAMFDPLIPDDVAAGSTARRYESHGHNLIGAAGANVDFSQEFNQIGDQTNVELTTYGNHWFAPDFDGGTTLTYALLPGSPAIDAGTCFDLNNALVTTDQRGMSRPRLGTCDIGAFEYGPPGSGRPPLSYQFVGFSAPVNPDGFNQVKAGQTIPLRWRLLDGNGNPVTTLSGVTVEVSDLGCVLGTTPDLPQEQAAGQSGLRHLGRGYYQFNWQTPRSYAGSCKIMTLTLHGSGLSRQALFKFTR